MHQRFGKLPWKDLFQPAIAYAEQGFPVTEGDSRDLGGAGESREFEDNPESARVFLPGGKAPQDGRYFRESRIWRTRCG